MLVYLSYYYHPGLTTLDFFEHVDGNSYGVEEDGLPGDDEGVLIL